MYKKLTACLLALAVFFTSRGAVMADHVSVTTSPYEIRLGNTELSLKVAEKGQNYQLSTGERVPYSISYGAGTTYLPLRKVADLLGVGIYFEGATKTIYIEDGTGETRLEDVVDGLSETKRVNMALSPYQVVVNGVQVASIGDTYTAGGSEVPFSISYGTGTAYLPLRKVAELLDIGIHFDAQTRTIYIVKTLSAAEEALAQKQAAEEAERAALEAEKELAAEVGHIQNRSITRNENDTGYDLCFTLTRGAEDTESLKLTVQVEITVKDEAGRVLAEGKATVRPADYIALEGKDTALVKIYDRDIPASETGRGTIRFRVSHPNGYFAFAPYSAAVKDLPVAEE